MTFAIHLVISDPNLADAVAEQLRLAQFTVTKGDKAAAIPAATAGLIVDQADFSVALPGTAPCMLLLGDGAGTEAAVSEYFSKPLRLGHLLARLRYHLEIAPRLRNDLVEFGPYRFDPQNRQLTVIDTGAVIRLTEKEAGLLAYIGQSEAPVSREDLLAAIWGYDGRIDTHTLETHIYQLRRKLDSDLRGAGLLRNEQGAYILSPVVRP